MIPELKERIQSLVNQHEVVLFMKGTKVMPQCGFSASVVQVLKEVGAPFETHNVLADPDLREGIKEFSEWPTIPQLYIKGEFQGGSNIVKEMYGKGELHQLLGVEAPKPLVPEIHLTESAAQALKGAGKEAEHPFLRLEIDGNFRHNLYFSPKQDQDVVVQAQGVDIVIEPMVTPKADGLRLDFVDGPGGSGFKIDNPNAPPTVQVVTVGELKAKLDEGGEIHLFDVRTLEERDIVKLEAARHYDDAAAEHARSLPKETTLYFICHKGGRSQAAAQQLLDVGFTQVFNVVGGFDAWARDIDPELPRY